MLLLSFEIAKTSGSVIGGATRTRRHHGRVARQRESAPVCQRHAVSAGVARQHRGPPPQLRLPSSSPDSSSTIRQCEVDCLSVSGPPQTGWVHQVASTHGSISVKYFMSVLKKHETNIELSGMRDRKESPRSRAHGGLGCIYSTARCAFRGDPAHSLEPTPCSLSVERIRSRRPHVANVICSFTCAGSTLLK